MARSDRLTNGGFRVIRRCQQSVAEKAGKHFFRQRRFTGCRVAVHPDHAAPIQRAADETFSDPTQKQLGRERFDPVPRLQILIKSLNTRPIVAFDRRGLSQCFAARIHIHSDISGGVVFFALSDHFHDFVAVIIDQIPVIIDPRAIRPKSMRRIKQAVFLVFQRARFDKRVSCPRRVVIRCVCFDFAVLVEFREKFPEPFALFPRKV